MVAIVTIIIIIYDVLGALFQDGQQVAFVGCQVQLAPLLGPDLDKADLVVVVTPGLHVPCGRLKQALHGCRMAVGSIAIAIIVVVALLLLLLLRENVPLPVENQDGRHALLGTQTRDGLLEFLEIGVTGSAGVFRNRHSCGRRHVCWGCG
jgi:hypothetical protein